MPETATYEGGCHCGQVRFKVTTDLTPVIQCNCSICSKKGYLLAFVPKGQLEVLSGGDQQADYQFGRRNIHHLFCRTCGVGSYSHGTGPDGAEMAAVNVRCLDGVDLDKLTITPFDGASM